MRILFIHEVNYLKKPIFEMHELPEYLAAKGHDVFFLHFPEGASSGELRKLGSSQEIAGRAIQSARITLLTPTILGTGIFFRLVAAALGSRIVKRAIAVSKPDVVVTLAVPTFGWQAVNKARQLGIPIVYRALDVSHLIRGGLLRPLVKIAEKFVARRADFVSANNSAMAEYISELRERASGVEVHLPPMALEKYRAGDRQLGRGLIGLSDTDHVVLYMGSFFYFSGLAEVVQEFSRLSPPTTTKLVMVGGGELDGKLRGLVKDLKLEDQVVFTGFVRFEDLPDCLAAADVLINPMKKSLVSETALPNKVIQYLAASRPAVSTNLRGVSLTFDAYVGLHLVSTPEQCIKKAIELLNEERPTDFQLNRGLLEEAFGSGTIASFESFLELVSVSR